MKNRIIILVTCLFALAVAVGAPYLLQLNHQGVRYHQHISATLRPEDEVEDGTFNTHLPLLCIDTGDAEIPGNRVKDPVTGHSVLDENGHHIFTATEDGEAKLWAHLDVIDHADTVNRPGDTPEISSDMRIRIRGNSSREFDKKNYYFELKDENGKDSKQPLLGMAAHHEWALHGPILDKTLMRNYMWYNIAGEIMEYAPNVRFCEVMLNGEYMGVYVLEEMITAGEDGARLPLTVSKKKNTYSGYVLRLDKTVRDDEAVDTFSKYTYRRMFNIEVKYPDDKNLTPEIKEAIRQDFSDFEKMLYSYDYDNNSYGWKEKGGSSGYESYIDVDSFVDYLLINEFTCNYDAGWMSTYMYKDVDGLFRMCIWDFNSACDNYQSGTQANPMHLEFQNNLWFNMLTKDEQFTQKVVKRYRYLRKNYFSEEYLNRYIDEVIAYLGPAIDRNFEVWGYTYEPEQDMLRPEERNPRTYEEAIGNMKTFLEKRGEWMDDNIDSILQYSNEAKIKKFNERAN